MENFEKILLAYDGSEHGRTALRRTLPLLGAGEVEVHLLAVVPLAVSTAVSVTVSMAVTATVPFAVVGRRRWGLVLSPPWSLAATAFRKIAYCSLVTRRVPIS